MMMRFHLSSEKGLPAPSMTIFGRKLRLYELSPYERQALYSPFDLEVTVVPPSTVYSGHFSALCWATAGGSMYGVLYGIEAFFASYE